MTPTAHQYDSWTGEKGSGTMTIIVRDPKVDFRSDIGTAMEKLARRHGLGEDQAWEEFTKMVQRYHQLKGSSCDPRKPR